MIEAFDQTCVSEISSDRLTEFGVSVPILKGRKRRAKRDESMLRTAPYASTR